MDASSIKILQASVHNLKNVDVEIPLKKITCISGPSGSGKSSLAFHCLFKESKRRFLNSFPSYLKFFSDRPEKVAVEKITPVLPVFAMPQINPIVGSRMAVSDISGVTEKLQLLFGSSAVEICLEHKIPLQKQPLSTLFNELKDKVEKELQIFVKSSRYKKMFPSAYPMRSFLPSRGVEQFVESDPFWEVKRLSKSSLSNYREDLELSQLLKSDSEPFYLLIDRVEWIEKKSTPQAQCSICGFQSLQKLEPKAFSPYNSLGACQHCQGFGRRLVFDEEKIFKEEKSVADGGVAFLEFKPFRASKLKLISAMKKEGIDHRKKIKSLGNNFKKISYEGKDSYPGLNKLFKYLERKKYKRNIRVFTRTMQKEEECPSCLTTRINPKNQCFALKMKSSYMVYHELAHLSFLGLREVLLSIDKEALGDYALTILDELMNTVNNAIDIGLSSTKIFRKARSVSAGEYQRLLFLKYFSFKGTGALYIFDEPSLGLSPTEQQKIFSFFENLCDQGNTVLLVEHSRLFKKRAQHLIEMGPLAGRDGGTIVYQGPPKLGPPLKYKPTLIAKKKKSYLTLGSLKVRDLHFKNVAISLGEINWLSGPSGSGKTSLMVHGLLNIINEKLSRPPVSEVSFAYQSFRVEPSYLLEETSFIASSYMKGAGRSTVGSATELVVALRRYLASLPIAKRMNLAMGHFSTNSKLGMCTACGGTGKKAVEMMLVEDLEIPCDVCNGKKLKPHIANIHDGHLYAYQYFERPIHEIIKYLPLTPKFQRIYQYMKVLNLHYLNLDRSLSELSGGEIQRLFLLKSIISLRKKTLFYIENISFGLSEIDLFNVFKVLEDLASKDHTIIISDNDPSLSQVAHYHLRLDAQQGVSTYKKLSNTIT